MKLILLASGLGHNLIPAENLGSYWNYYNANNISKERFKFWETRFNMYYHYYKSISNKSTIKRYIVLIRVLCMLYINGSPNKVEYLET